MQLQVLQLATNPQEKGRECFRQQIGVCRRPHPDKILTHDSSARKAAVKYAVDAVNYLMDAAGSSLPTEIYYLS